MTSQAGYAFDAARTDNALGFSPYVVESSLQKDIYEFFSSIAHLSIDDSCTDEGLNLILNEFEKFLIKQNCYNAIQSLRILRREKGTDDPYRADGSTPNILHEIRNCTQILSMIGMGYIPMHEYHRYGDLDADISARLRHDSIEDKAKSKLEIYSALEENLHGLVEAGVIDDDEHYSRRLVATIAAENIDLMTRKDAQIDLESGVIKTSKKGKIKKVERYGGDTNKYWYKLLTSPLALLCKYSDRTENVGTRFGIERFTTTKNEKYAKETREIYGTENFDDRAIAKWPHFEKAIRAADDMLGIHLTILEGVNKYDSNPALDPEGGEPFRLSRYLPNALFAFQLMPACVHPLSVTIHSLKRNAQNDPRTTIILKDLILPPIQEAIRDFNIQPIKGIPTPPHKKNAQLKFDFGEPLPKPA